jgi:hypothetical protein
MALVTTQHHKSAVTVSFITKVKTVRVVELTILKRIVVMEIPAVAVMEWINGEFRIIILSVVEWVQNGKDALVKTVGRARFVYYPVFNVQVDMGVPLKTSRNIIVAAQVHVVSSILDLTVSCILDLLVMCKLHVLMS